MADRKHLERNGRFITGDNYIAMKNGPVASNIYNFIKAVRGDNVFISGELLDRLAKSFSVDNYNINPLRNPDLDYLSKSDIQCLDESIADNKALTFGQLNDKSHDELWKSANPNGDIPFSSFVKHAPDSELLAYHLNLN